MSNEITPQDVSDILSCLMVPTQGKNLILPNVTVAEVIPFIDPVQRANTPTWFLGYTGWRGTQIPVISFETANHQIHAADSADVRIAVLNGTTGNVKLPFFGMVVQGIPRMIKVGTQDIQSDNNVLSAAEKMSVNTTMGRAIIPNLDYLESLIEKVI